MKPDQKGVFISHIVDEAPVADALKVYLKRCFGDTFPVFVSSDYDSIATGEEWYRSIVKAVKQAGVVVVLLSRYSLDRPWINFESGLARGADVTLLPLTIRGLQPGDVPLPLSQLHVRGLADPLALEGIVRAIGEATHSAIIQMSDGSDFIARITQIESTLPVSGISLEPVTQNSSASGPVVRFRLSNTGNRDVELIEVEVSIPKAAMIRLDWSPHSIPNVISSESRMIGSIDHLVIWEQPYEGPQDVMRYGGHRTLPRVVSPHWTPRFSDLIKIPIRQDFKSIWNYAVTYKVVARGLYVEPGRVALAEIPILD